MTQTEILNNSKTSIAGTLLSQPDDAISGIGQWKFTAITKIKGKDDIVSSQGNLTRQLGFNSYLQTIIPDSKKYPYYTISQEVKDDVKEILCKIFPSCKKENVNFFVAGENTNPNQGSLSSTIVSIDMISDDVVKIFASYKLAVTVENMDNMGLVHINALRQYCDMRNIKDIEGMKKLNMFIMPYMKELSLIKEPGEYVNKMADILDIYDDLNNNDIVTV